MGCHSKSLPEHLYGLIEPDYTRIRQLQETARHVERVLDGQIKHSMDLANRLHFDEVDKERSRRTLHYAHDWVIGRGHEHVAEVSTDSALLADNCGLPLMLSVNEPELDPVFGPDLIMFNGRGDECEDFIYPPTKDAGFGSNRGTCRTDCRDYDTLVSTVLLSVKHNLGKMAYVTSNAEPNRESWQAAFALYARTFPERDIPRLNNWPSARGHVK